MTSIILQGDCGNSPKNIFIKELTIAFARRDTTYILTRISDDFRWNVVGQHRFNGKDELVETLDQLKNDQVSELTIDHVVTHGKAGAVNGRASHENRKVFAFCEVYEFSNAKGTSIQEIISYRIEVT